MGSKKEEIFLQFASNGNLQEINKLITSDNINVNAKDADAITAVMHASDGGHVDVMKRLIELGANVSQISIPE